MSATHCMMLGSLFGVVVCVRANQSFVVLFCDM